MTADISEWCLANISETTAHVLAGSWSWRPVICWLGGGGHTLQYWDWDYSTSFG